MTDLSTLLPRELLYQVFLLLTPRDRKSVVLVCRRWRTVGEDPRLWTWVQLTLTPHILSSMSCTVEG